MLRVPPDSGFSEGSAGPSCGNYSSAAGMALVPGPGRSLRRSRTYPLVAAAALVVVGLIISSDIVLPASKVSCRFGCSRPAYRGGAVLCLIDSVAGGAVDARETAVSTAEISRPAATFLPLRSRAPAVGAGMRARAPASSALAECSGSSSEKSWTWSVAAAR